MAMKTNVKLNSQNTLAVVGFCFYFFRDKILLENVHNLLILLWIDLSSCDCQ